MKVNPGLAACHNGSQTHETGTGEKESNLFKCQPLKKMGSLVLRNLS